MKFLPVKVGFLSIPDESLGLADTARVVIQQVPYEHTSSYISGSHKGPAAMVAASHFVEFYDEELGIQTYKHLGGMVTAEPMDFTNLVDERAIDAIEAQTAELLEKGKFVVSFGAEHTVSLGFVKAFSKKFNNLSVLQIDAHSDLRDSYQGNKYSHASVMARVNELGLKIVQVGIRAQCVEESQLIQASPNISTWYAHQLWDNDEWIDECIESLTENVYLTIDADGFDPSFCPAVGTAEPGGLEWKQGCKLFRKLAEERNVVGFDIVEIAPREADIITEFSMAKMCYKILGYLSINKRI